MRKSIHSNRDLPAPRILSELLTKANSKATDFSHTNLGAIMFGQLIAHDTSFKIHPQGKAGGPGVRCCTLDGSAVLPNRKLHPQCAPIIGTDGRCTTFLRAQCVIDNDCLLSPRLPVNSKLL